MVRIFYGLLTAYIIMLFIVAMLFNIAPITYIVFGVAIVLFLVLQYDWYPLWGTAFVILYIML